MSGIQITVQSNFSNKLPQPQLILFVKYRFNVSDAGASFLDLHLSMSDGFVGAGVCGGRDGFGFGVVDFPFLDGGVPRSASCGVCVSQLVRFARVSGRVGGFGARGGVLAAGLLRQGCGCRRLRGAFSGFCRRRFGMVSGCGVGLGALLLRGLSGPGFCGDLVYKFGGMVGEIDFPCRFRGIIVRYGEVGCGVGVMRQTACLVVGPIGVNSFAYLFNCTTVGRTSD